MNYPPTQKPAVAKQQLINPWLIILLTAPVPLMLFVLFFVKWYQQKTDFRRITSQFIQRQNSVMAYDAVEVATGFSDLLYKAARDVQVFALLPPTADNLTRFYRSQMGDFTRYDTKNNAVIQEPLPFYNRLAFLSPKGDTVIELVDGALTKERRSLGDCRKVDLCDRELFEKAIQLSPGEIHYGRILRPYSSEGVAEVDKGASLSVAYRGTSGVYLLGIDYLHLRDHLTTPAFPYDSKRDLLQAYQRGNYIYIVDSDNNIITHPKYFHVAGIDRATGEWMPAMRNDDDNGKRPINIAAYQGNALRDYFNRLLTVSFVGPSVDIFQATNFAGTIRVLSVAPIHLSLGQFKKSGVFGHAILGCSVDYFEEPKEKIVPYY